jgi:beta-xylosidase
MHHVVPAVCLTIMVLASSTVASGALPESTTSRAALSQAHIEQQSASQATVAHGFSDDFSTATLNPSWQWINEDPNTWSLTAVPGSLRIIGVPGEMYSACNNPKNLLLQTPSSSNFELIAKLSIDPQTDYQQGGLVVFNSVGGQVDMDNYIKLDVLYNTNMGGRSAELLPEEHGAYRGTWPYIAAPQSQPAYLKMTKLGAEYVGYHSTDGVSWTKVGSVQVPTIQQPLVGLYAVASVTVSDCNPVLPHVIVDFEYFQYRDLSVFLPLVTSP